jgi:HK97 family phage major capsid protein
VQLNAREQRLVELESSDANAEAGANFNTNAPGAVRGEDIYDLSTVRMTASSPEGARAEMHERAKRSIDAARFPHQRADEASCKAHVERMLAISDNRQGDLARLILATGSETYKRAFGKSLQGQQLSTAEYQAISETGGGGEDGGFAVPYVLDPTIIPTSDQKVNPYRAICRTVQLVGARTWKGVSSAGVVATRRNEGDESSDNSPTFAQPSVDVQRADVFIPFSVELQQDWGAMSTELALLIQDAKDVEEASSFTVGNGTAPMPAGLLTGATITVPTAATATFASTDLDATEEALGPRFQARAQWVGNRATYNLIRHFATDNGPDLWVRIADPLAAGGNTGRTLLGYAANEASAMPTGTASETPLLVLGDFNYLAIVDRIGMSIEVIPTLFGPNGRPTGQRGFYAVWRNSVLVTAANAFRVLVAK